MLATIWTNKISHPSLVGIQNGTATLKDSLAISSTKQILPQDLAVLVLGIYPEGLKTYVYSETCTWKFTVAFFIIAKTWKQSKCLPIHELINCGISRQHYIKEMSYSMKRHGGIESILL